MIRGSIAAPEYVQPIMFRPNHCETSKAGIEKELRLTVCVRASQIFLVVSESANRVSYLTAVAGVGHFS